MFLLNGQPLGLDVAFSDANGTQYPNNWVRLASPDERAAIGITEAPDPEPYDDRYYWGVGNPKDIEMVKAMLNTQIKQTAYNMLAATDYKIVRQAETGETVDSETLTYRAAVRTAYQANKTEINSATSVDALAALQLTWPSA